jgi:hypothetical protein
MWHFLVFYFKYAVKNTEEYIYYSCSFEDLSWCLGTAWIETDISRANKYIYVYDVVNAIISTEWTFFIGCKDKLVSFLNTLLRFRLQINTVKANLVHENFYETNKNISNKT